MYIETAASWRDRDLSNVYRQQIGDILQKKNHLKERRSKMLRILKIDENNANYIFYT